MRADLSSLIPIVLVIIANNVCTAYSKCYVDQRISNKVRNDLLEFKNCPNFTKINCQDDSLQNFYSKSELLDISTSEEGREKIHFNTKLSASEPKLLLEIFMNHIRFQKLLIRLLRNNERDDETTCHFIDSAVTQSSNLSGLFSASMMYDTVIEIFMETDGSNYFRNYTFKVPDKNSYDPHKLNSNSIFTWIDISKTNDVRLHIQPLNKIYNVTTYSVKVYCNKTLVATFNISGERYYHDWSNNSAVDTRCYFGIEPIPNNCGGYCNTASASFVILGSSSRLIIMIVSIVFVPFAVFFVLHLTYAWYINHVRSKRKPNCLLIHSGSPQVHVDVMIKLAEYLRASEINAMIDVLDISKETLNNPNLWCQEAFERATTIIVSGCPLNVDDSKPMYRWLYQFALNLIHANDPCQRRLNGKDYITLKFPYCKLRSEIPPDARLFNVIKLPKELDKLVKKIRGYDDTGLYKKLPAKYEFLTSVKMANNSICHGKNLSPFNGSSTIVIDDETIAESVYSYGSDLESVSGDSIDWGEKRKEEDEESDEEEGMIEDTHNSDAFFSGYDDCHRGRC